MINMIYLNSSAALRQDRRNEVPDEQDRWWQREQPV